MEMEYVLGCGQASTPAQEAHFVLLIETYGKLICILCNQSLSATRKSLQKHQMTKRHSTLHNDVISQGREFPTSDYAMEMILEPPPSGIIYPPPAQLTAMHGDAAVYEAVPDNQVHPMPQSSMSTVDSSVHQVISIGDDSLSAESPTKKAPSQYIVDASIMATSITTG
jgi:hypothetical protein